MRLLLDNTSAAEDEILNDYDRYCENMEVVLEIIQRLDEELTEAKKALKAANDELESEKKKND